MGDFSVGSADSAEKGFCCAPRRHVPLDDDPTPHQTHQGNNVKLDKYKDKKVILVVNVASQCTLLSWRV